MQVLLGSCSFSDIALIVACPILCVYHERKQVVIYGGGIHFAKDSLINEKGKTSFGIPVEILKDG